MTQYEHENIGTNICPGVFYAIPGDRSGKLYSFKDLPFDESGNRRMGCKVVDSHPCTNCGKCSHNDDHPEMYAASWMNQPSFLRLPGLIY